MISSTAAPHKKSKMLIKSTICTLLYCNFVVKSIVNGSASVFAFENPKIYFRKGE
jgi:hypothetical protein